MNAYPLPNLTTPINGKPKLVLLRPAPTIPAETIITPIFNWGCGGNGQFWVVNGDPKIIGTFGPTGQWFATTNPDRTPIFTAPATGTFNHQRVRNLIHQPGYQNWNMGLFKTIPVNERLRFQFRAEAYNVWNHLRLEF